MEQTVPLCIHSMCKVLHVVDDVLLEAYTAGQEVVIPSMNAIPVRHVQVHNVHFCMIHGWTVVVSLPVVECSLPISLPSPLVPMGNVESSATVSMEVELAAPPPPPPTVAAVRRRRSPTSPEPVVAGTIAAITDNLLALSTLCAGTSSSPATAPMGWPRLPPPVRGPKGPPTGPWWMAPLRR